MTKTTYHFGKKQTFEVVTSNYVAREGDCLAVDTTTGPVTITLPEKAQIGSRIELFDFKSSFALHNCILHPVVINLEGALTDIPLTSDNEQIALTYINATEGWNFNGDHSSS